MRLSASAVSQTDTGTCLSALADPGKKKYAHRSLCVRMYQQY